MSRIDIIVHTLNHSGISHAACTLANGLASEHFHVRLVVIDKILELPYPLASTIEQYSLNISKTGKISYICQSIVGLAQYLLKEKPKNLFIWGKEFGCLGIFLKYLLRRQCRIIFVNVNSIHGHLQYHKNYCIRILHHFCYKRCFPKADYVIAQTDGMAPELINHYNISPTKLGIIYPPLNATFFAAHPVVTKKDEVIFIGRLSHQKAPERLIEIFSHIPAPTILRILGDGPLKERLIEQAKKLKIEHRIVFEGKIDHIIPYLQQAKILALTSRYEGFGMVLAESIACGTPVISYDCPVGPADIIQEGVNGYLIPADNRDLFIKKLNKSLQDPWDCLEIQKTALKFSPDNIIKSYISVIRHIFRENQ